MKTSKRILTLVLAIAMVFAVCVSGVSADTYSVTVNNAMAETTYTLYKAFDASYDGTAVSYTLDASTTGGAALKTAIENGNLFTLKQLDTAGNTYEVTKTDDATDVTIAAFLKDNLSNLTKVDTKTCAVGAETVVFNPEGPGYFLVTAQNKGDDEPGSVVTITTAAPSATVIDKNPRIPSDLDKTAGAFSAQIGEEVPFTVSFKAVNFRTNENKETNRIIEYILTDTAVTGLDFLSETDDTVFGDADGSITLFKTKNDDGTFDDAYDDYNVSYKYDAKTHKLTIIWGTETKDGTGKVTSSASLYPTNTWVVINYSMKMNKNVFTSNAFVDADNKVEGDMKLSEVDAVEGFGEDNATVKTTGISLEKVDAANNSTTLEGAQFILRNSDGKFWTYSNGKVVWVDKQADAQKATADNDAQTPEFYGLDEGTYYITEVNAPSGYKIATSDFTLTIGKSSDGTSLTASLGTTSLSANAKGVFSGTIANTKGSALPETGGIGTTLFYIIGALLLAAALTAIVLKRRSAKND